MSFPTGFTVYRQMDRKEVTDFSRQIGWETHQDDISGMMSSSNILRSIYTTKFIDEVYWIAIPDHLVNGWKNQFSSG